MIVMIEYYENECECGLVFKEGIDPQILIDAIQRIDKHKKSSKVKSYYVWILDFDL